jgi:hypothetical protein
MMALLCFFLTLVPVGNVPGHDETTLEMRSRHLITVPPTLSIALLRWPYSV